MFKLRLPALLLAGAALIGTSAAGTYALVSNPTPVGQYSGGDFWVCTKVGSVIPHTGKTSVPCPSGYGLVKLPTTAKAGPAGPQGPKGDTGAASTVVGPQGPKGDAGAKGDDGADGQDAPAPAYGVELVKVSRGGAAATTWASYSTPIVDVIGGTTGGSFRFTCSAAKAPCVVSVQAYSTDAGTQVYPRLLIQKSSIDTGAPVGLCEYADGDDNDGGSQAVGTTPTDLNLGIGGSLDCGSDQVRPDSGVVTSIKVPAGYYDAAVGASFALAS